MMNQPIRIAHLIGKANLSGVDTVVMEYYRNIDRQRIQFDFIIDGYDETPIDCEIMELGGQIYKVEPYEHGLIESMRQWYDIFKENRYSIVHSHLNTLSVFPLFAAWLAKVPIRIAHNHSTAAGGEGIKTILKHILRPSAKFFSTHYCTCSSIAGKWMFGEQVYNAGKVHLIKNAINVDKFSYDVKVRDKVRQELNIEEKWVIGHVGRFAYAKNHDFLINIFHEIYKSEQNAILMLVGAGELELEAKQKVERLGLADSVLFLGKRTDVSELMQAMDVFVFPSNYEGLGMAVIEAQAAGLQTIVSEAVPKEADITGLFEYCSLSQTASVWAERVLAHCRSETYTRRKHNREVNEAGYDIIIAADKLRKWYEGLGSR